LVAVPPTAVGSVGVGVGPTVGDPVTTPGDVSVGLGEGLIVVGDVLLAEPGTVGELGVVVTAPLLELLSSPPQLAVSATSKATGVARSGVRPARWRRTPTEGSVARSGLGPNLVS